MHELDSLVPPYVFVEVSPEVIGDIVFPVGEGPGSAESVHDRTGLALYAGLHLLSVYGTFSLFQAGSGFKHCHPELRILLCQLIRREYTPGPGSHYDHIIFISHRLLHISFQK